MAYTLETIDELFLVTKQFSDDVILHIVMSKNEIQNLIKDDFRRKLVKKIVKLKLDEEKQVTFKYFLPKNWQKINQRTTAYRIYKEIYESEE